MTPDLALSLAGFAFATSITPGPNNLMLMASGLNFGLGRTVPHLLGVALGFGAMVFVVGMGIAGLLLAEPAVVLGLKVLAVGYMLWLAWKIATAAPPAAGTPGGTPIGFAAAAAFQWVNPKAWAMALTAAAVYAPQGGAGPVALVAAVFCAINLPSVAVWAGMGQMLRRLIGRPGWIRGFNRTMAVLLVLSLWPALRL